jgi:hypothetical protein
MTALLLPCVCPVAGVSFRPETVAACVEGDQVIVRRDPANPYDNDACAVYHINGGQLGFLPKTLAARITGDGPWSGSIVAVLHGEQSTGLRIRVEGPVEPSGAAEVTPHDAGTRPSRPPLEPPATAALVQARSGRILGELLHTDGTTVHVKGAGGAAVAYPTHLVKIVTSDATGDW